MSKITIRLDVNDKILEIKVQPHWTLLYILRNKFGLIGAKLGCGKGECGACTVIIDGNAVPSCLVLAIRAEGKKITTIERLHGAEELDPLQEAFVKHNAVQCGFCTPGMNMTSKALLDKVSHPSVEEIKRGLTGNLCRCTGYVKIIEAVKNVSTTEASK